MFASGLDYFPSLDFAEYCVFLESFILLSFVHVVE